MNLKVGLGRTGIGQRQKVQPTIAAVAAAGNLLRLLTPYLRGRKWTKRVPIVMVMTVTRDGMALPGGKQRPVKSLRCLPKC